MLTTGGGQTGAATYTGGGSGNPNEKPMRTPAWADKLAAPITAAARSILVFISFNMLSVFISGLAVSAACPHPPLRGPWGDLAEKVEM